MASERTQAEQATSLRMGRVRRRDTAAEMSVRRALHALGCRYRLQVPVPGRPRRTIDIAFTRARIAVFIDGCYWHSCPIHGTTAKTNREWWRHKLQANQQRDEDTNRVLNEAGWMVLRIWEHDDPGVAAQRIALAVLERAVTQ